MRIPATFKLMNRSFTVVQMEENARIASATHGIMDLENGIIQVASNANDETVEHTFLHELMHALFETAGRKDLSSNEDLVDLMSAALHQYLQTKKGRLYE